MARSTRGSHRQALLRCGLEAASFPGLAAYLDLLAEWSARVNLTGAGSPEERVEILVASVLPLLPWLLPGRLLDLGSGNGSPGLVLALLRPDLKATLLEPRMRRWAFLKEAARAAGRPEIEILRLRHDAFTGEPAQTVTLRALALPLAELSGLVVPRGRVIVLGRRPAEAPGFREETGPEEKGPHVFCHERST